MSQPEALQRLASHLCKGAQEIASIIGLPATLRLIERLGGTSLVIPRGLSPCGQQRLSELAEIVGEEAAVALALYGGGDSLYVPRCATALRLARDVTICRAFDAMIETTSTPAAVRELAKQHRITERRVYAILKNTDPAAVRSGLGLAPQPAKSAGRVMERN